MRIVSEMQTFINKSSLCLAALIVGSSVGCAFLGNREVNKVQPSPVEQTANLQNNANFIAEVVREVGPAVVRIDATRTVEVPINSIDPLIERFLARTYFPLKSESNAASVRGLLLARMGAY